MPTSATVRQLFALVLSVIALAGGSALLADTVSIVYWKGGIASAEREIGFADGELVRWNWDGGVTYATGQDREREEKTIKREDVFKVTRGWGAAFESTALEGSLADLEELISSDDSGLSAFAKEEGWYLLAIRSGQEKYLSKYVSSYPNGCFIDEMRTMLAESKIAAGDQQAAFSQYQEIAKLGRLQYVRAYIGMGRYWYQQGDFKKAATYYDDETARTNATAVRMPIEELQIYAYGGQCLRMNGNDSAAKSRFEHALKIDTTEGSHAESRAIANFGMGELATDADTRFDAYMSAAYWYEGQSKEADALLKAMEVAAGQQRPDPDHPWTKRYKAVRAALQKLFPERLREADAGDE